MSVEWAHNVIGILCIPTTLRKRRNNCDEKNTKHKATTIAKS